MKHITSTLFNSFDDYADSATQLHIYAFEIQDEYEEAKEVGITMTPSLVSLFPA